MLIDLFHGTELLGNYVFVVDVQVFWVAAICYLALLGSIPVLANLPQPKPVDIVNWGALPYKQAQRHDRNRRRHK